MRTSTWSLCILVGLAALCHIGFTSPVVKRQILGNAVLHPEYQDLDQNEADRGKRLIEPGVQLKFGAKNVVLGLLFNKINQFIDSKTAWVHQLDQLNVAKNKAYGIEPPKDPVSSFGELFGSVLSTKLQAAGPVISLVTQKLGSASGGSGGLLHSLGSLFGGSSGGGAGVAASTTVEKPANIGASAGLSFGYGG